MCISFSCKTKWNSYMYIYPPSWTSFSCPYPTLLGHHRAPSWAPCATQQLPLLIYFTHGGIHMSMLPSQFVPPFPSHTMSKVCSLCLCLYSSPANRFISTIFLDSTTQQSHYWEYPEKTIIEKDTCTPIFTVALFTIARTWKHPKMSIDRWMDKEVVVHICNGVLLSHIKENI